MKRLFATTLITALFGGCASNQPPQTSLLLGSPPENADDCKGSEGKNKGKNESDCVITVEVTPPQDPDGRCTVKVNDDQKTVVFSNSTGKPRWIIWRLNDSSRYAFESGGAGVPDPHAPRGVQFKKSAAPFEDKGPTDKHPDGEYARLNNGKTSSVFISQEWDYNINLKAKATGKPGCSIDPTIRNE